MLCYRGKTYCPFSEDCALGRACDRSLTPEVKRRAEASNLPVALYAEIPDCFDPKEPSA